MPMQLQRDTVVPRDLRARQYLFDLGQSETPRPLVQATDVEPPIRKLVLRELLVDGITRLGRPVGAEFGRKISFGVFACQRASAGDNLLSQARNRFRTVENLCEPGALRLSQPPRIKIRY